MVTDESGQVVWQNELTPFGEECGEIGSVHLAAKFTGKDLDEETGLHYFNARWYDSAIGRFISVDPARDGLNWFVYCYNNPMVFVDPSGLEAAEQLAEGIRQVGVSKLELVEIARYTVPGWYSAMLRGGGIGFIIGFVLCLQGDAPEVYIPIGTNGDLIRYRFISDDLTYFTDTDEDGNEVHFLIDNETGEVYNTEHLTLDEDGIILRPTLPPNYKYRNGNIIAPSGGIIPTPEKAWEIATEYSGSLNKVNKADSLADLLAERIGGISRVRFENSNREFDAISDKYIAQSKPALKTLSKEKRNQFKATYEAAIATGRIPYFHFEGKPAERVLRQIDEYNKRYNIEAVVDIEPLQSQ
jgi:RHS repeat-associated protein